MVRINQITAGVDISMTIAIAELWCHTNTVSIYIYIGLGVLNFNKLPTSDVSHCIFHIFSIKYNKL